MTPFEVIEKTVNDWHQSYLGPPRMAAAMIIENLRDHGYVVAGTDASEAVGLPLLDLDAIEALARAATPGPWQWQDYETDEVVTGDDGEYLRNQDDYGGPFSLRTVWHRESSCGPLPEFIVSHVEEVKAGDGWFLAKVTPDVVLGLVARIRQLEAQGDPDV